MRQRNQDGFTGEDETLSIRRDRCWGDDCPCHDIDHVVVNHTLDQPCEWFANEYAHAKSCGLIEYKALRGRRTLSYKTLWHANVKALLSIPVALPVGVVVYQPTASGPWDFWIPLKHQKPDETSRSALGNDLFRSTLKDFLRAEKVKPEIADLATGISGVVMGEENWVRYLYRIRDLAIPQSVIDTIKGLQDKPHRTPFNLDDLVV